MESLENLKVIAPGQRARKRAVRNENWKKNEEKTKRYKAKDLPTILKCKHKGDKFKCAIIKSHDAYKFHKDLYASKTKQGQESFILNYVKCKPPVRTDRRKLGSVRNLSTEFFVRLYNKKMVRVCQKMFLKLTGFSKFRVQNLVKNFFENGTIPKETRGGDRRSHLYNDRKKCIIDFVRKFKAIEVHYCRSNITQRQYLPSSLSINELYRLFKKENSNLNNVKQSYFRQVFNENFNVGFKLPSQDQCFTCLMLKERISLKKKENPVDTLVINELITQLRVHKLRSKAFFNLAKEERPDLITFSFDCQKNMVLPKVQDQAAYYSRQFSLFNFGVVEGSSKSSLDKENVFLYIWHEHERQKGSNEIVSAMFNRLCNTSFKNKNVVRFICDGCGAQNKHSSMMGMCAYWLVSKAPSNVKKIELIFPVPRHSFIPPDRVFAHIEKRVKKVETIINPAVYYDIYNEFGTVYFLGSEVEVYDWKTALSTLMKTPGNWHFKFNKAKRFLITRSKKDKGFLVQGETSYKSNLGVKRSVLKKGNKGLASMQLDTLPIGVQIKSEKMKDVDKLLQKHFGMDWKDQPHEDLQFYKAIFMSKDLPEAMEESLCDNIQDLSTEIV